MSLKFRPKDGRFGTSELRSKYFRLGMRTLFFHYMHPLLFCPGHALSFSHNSPSSYSVSLSRCPDWDQMKKSDVEDLVHRLPRDKKSREEFRSFVEGLVRADLGPEHYSLFTEPANVVQLFRVMQLSVEWAVYVQKHEIKRREAAEDAFAKLKAENKGLTAELKRLQEELRKGQSPAFRCPYCPNGKVLVDAERARKHMAKHFDKPAPPPPPPPPPPAPMPQPQNLDELKDYLRRLLDGMPDKSAIASILAWLQENCARRPETKDQHDGVMNKLEALSNKLDNIEAKVSQPAAPRPQTPPRVRTPPPAPRPEPEHIPRPAPPAPPAPESPRSRLRRVLEKRKYHKHIWFKQYPFLLARYPPPPVARIMDALANKRAIVRGMTSDRLQHMQVRPTYARARITLPLTIATIMMTCPCVPFLVFFA